MDDVTQIAGAASTFEKCWRKSTRRKFIASPRALSAVLTYCFRPFENEQWAKTLCSESNYDFEANAVQTSGFAILVQYCRHRFVYARGSPAARP